MFFDVVSMSLALFENYITRFVCVPVSELVSREDTFSKSETMA